MTSTLVDSNVLLDVLTNDPVWSPWSAGRLREAGETGPVVINPVIYAETSAHFLGEAEFDRTISAAGLTREPLPWPAAFQAGRAHRLYRQGGGTRERTLPDFLIGAHALAAKHRLLHARRTAPPLPLSEPSDRRAGDPSMSAPA